MKNLTFWERLFPVKYNFYAMITEQAHTMAQGVAALEIWLQNPSPDNAEQLRALTAQADTVRFHMEAQLIEAFVTPFDRQDIYSLSIEMDRILEYAKSTMDIMAAYEVFSDDTVLRMALDLSKGSQLLYEAVASLEEHPHASQVMIPQIRRYQSAVEDRYHQDSAALFKSTDLTEVIKTREVYHHIKDAAINLGYTVDVLHRIVVRII